MEKLIIRGGKPLSGRILPSGSKNAALPIIFSTLILRGTSVIYNVPEIGDVAVALRILEELGASVRRIRDAVYINTDNVSPSEVRAELTSSIRASSYLLGAMLSRFGEAKISSFGGCNFENRPIDMHLYAAGRLGAKISPDTVFADTLTGGDILFDKPSVGATVNSILLGVGARGKTRIYNYAREPHVISLIRFLRTAGARIALFSDRIEIEHSPLSSGVATIIPDVIEGATYLSLFMATSSSASVGSLSGEELSSYLNVMTLAGAAFSACGSAVSVASPPTRKIEITTSPYPGFPTDLQPQTAPVMALFSGGEITELVWRSRFGYLAELEKFGLKYTTSSNKAKIYPSRLRPAEAVAIDLRAGAAILIAALSTEGESVIHSPAVIRRGYSDLVNKLRALGADIEEVS